VNNHERGSGVRSLYSFNFGETINKAPKTSGGGRTPVRHTIPPFMILIFIVLNYLHARGSS